MAFKLPIRKTVQNLTTKMFGSGPGDNSILGQWTAPKKPATPAPFIGPVLPSNPNIRNGVAYKPNPASTEDMPVSYKSPAPVAPRLASAPTSQITPPNVSVASVPINPMMTAGGVKLIADPNNPGGVIPANSPVSAQGTQVTPVVPPVTPNTPAKPNYEQKVLDLMNPSDEENRYAQDLTDFTESARLGISGLEGQGRGIPLDLVRGQQSKLQEQANIKTQTLQQRMALAQSKRLASLEASKFALERSDVEFTREETKRKETEATEKANRDRQQKYVENGVTTPFVNVGGTFERVSDGKRYSSMPDFLKDAGVTDLGQAVANKLISDYKGPKGEGFTLGEGQIRYDDKGKPIAVGPAKTFAPDSSDTGKIVTIDGKSYWQDATGNLSDPKIPNATPSADKVTKATEVVTKIQALLDNPNLSKAIGPASSQIPGFLRSGDRNDVDAAIDALIAGIAIENLSLLKGPMSDKDVAFIKEASSGLKKNMSEEGFKSRLTELKNKFNEIKAKAEKGEGETQQTMEVDGVKYQKVQGGWQQVGFNQAGNASASTSGMRTDRHNNPAAFTTDVARTAGLVEGRDYVAGDPFPNNPNLRTAKLLGDPVKTTIEVINRIGFYTQSGKQRWSYIGMPQSQWNSLSEGQKKNVVAQMYQKEGNKGALNKYFA